jgi:hypothetical protein
MEVPMLGIWDIFFVALLLIALVVSALFGVLRVCLMRWLCGRVGALWCERAWTRKLDPAK